MKLRLTAYGEIIDKRTNEHVRSVMDIREFEIGGSSPTRQRSRTRGEIIGREVLKQLSMPDVTIVMVSESPYRGGV